MTEERLTELNERSKDDHAFIAGSEVRELIMALRAERTRIAKAKKLADKWDDGKREEGLYYAQCLQAALDGEEKNDGRTEQGGKWTYEREEMK
jgi:hypothetical protein